MKNETFRRNFKWLVLLAILALVSPVLWWTTKPAHSQQPTQLQIVTQVAPPHGEPQVEVLKASINGEAITLGSAFSAVDGYLENLSIDVKNVSTKGITFMTIGLQLFNNAENRVPDGLYRLSYGNFTAVQGAKASISIKSNEIVSISLSDSKSQGNSLKEVIMRSAPNLRKVGILIGNIVFDDNTSWHNGFFHYREPSNSQKWIAIRDVKTSKSSAQAFAQPAKFSPRTRSQSCGYYTGWGAYDCGTLCAQITDWFSPGTLDQYTTYYESCFHIFAPEVGCLQGGPYDYYIGSCP